MNAERYKKFVLLHSNDMHGDFLAEVQGAEGNLIGGLAWLSGYVNAVRQREENVLYVVSGDMVQGSLIDAEYKGISTMEIMNYLSPDVVTLGNHELDYGLSHLLFLEKMANFPIVNANLYIKKYHKRLFRPHLVLNVDGFDILFIGVITEAALMSLREDSDVGTFVGLEDAATEVGKICNAYKDEDIDLTILLTHIGFESDRKLAEMLDPTWGVDLIIGGHSHTILDKPVEVNGILIVQAGVGTDQVGRFDLVVDDDTNSIVEWAWQLIPVDDKLAEPDAELRAFIDALKQEVDAKYNTLITRFATQLTHPQRTEETSLGNLFADLLAARANADVVFVGSGSIRVKALGPVVTLGNLAEAFPYDDALQRFEISGAQLKRVFAHIMRPENRGGEGECYQVNHGVQATYNEARKELESLSLNGEPVADQASYTIALQGFHVKNASPNLGISQEELMERAGSTLVTSSVRDVVEEHMRSHQNQSSRVEGRLVYKAADGRQ